MEGATEHSAAVQALIDDLIERGLDPAVPRLFIIDRLGRSLLGLVEFLTQIHAFKIAPRLRARYWGEKRSK